MNFILFQLKFIKFELHNAGRPSDIQRRKDIERQPKKMNRSTVYIIIIRLMMATCNL